MARTLTEYSTMPTLRISIITMLAAVLLMAGCASPADEAAASRLLGDAVSSLPCVLSHDVSYNNVASTDGSLAGKIHVSDAACFESALRAIARLPDFSNGRPTTVYLIGMLPSGDAVMPETFGFPHKPILRLLRERYATGS